MKTNQIIIQKLKNGLFPAIFLSFTISISGPVTLYFDQISNNDLPFYLWSFLPFSILSFLILSILLLLPMLFIPEQKQQVYAAILLGIALSLYVEGIVINYNYGLLDGTSIDWSLFKTHGLIDSITWLILILLPILYSIWKKQKSIRFFSVIAVLMLGQQVVTVLLSALITPVPKIYQTTNQDLFSLSSNKNVLVFILDSFDQSLFTELLQQDESIKDELSGFTFYPDAVNAYTHTDGAVPFMLTGEKYRNEIPFKDYVNLAWERSSFITKAKDNNYSVGIYTQPNYISPALEGTLTNYRPLRPDMRNAAGYIFRLTLYKYAPHFLKHYFWFYPDLSTASADSYDFSNLGFYRLLSTNPITSDKQNNVFWFYHLQGPHGPYNMDENLQEIENASILQQAHGSLGILFNYFSQMKELGIFDNSQIIICADHARLQQPPANPLLLIKPFGQAKEFSTSSASVSYLENFYPTILEAISQKDEGTSFTDVQTVQTAPRYFYYYNLFDHNVVQGYLPELSLYEVKSKAWESDNIHQTGDYFVPPDENYYFEPYVYGGLVRLSYVPNVTSNNYYFQSFIHSGLLPVFESGSWTTEKEITMELSLPETPEHDLILNLVSSDIRGDLQKIDFSVNEEFIGSYEVTKARQVTKVRIAKDSIKDTNISIRLSFPDAITDPLTGFNNSVFFESFILSVDYPEINVPAENIISTDDAIGGIKAQEIGDDLIWIEGHGRSLKQDCTKSQFIIELSDSSGTHYYPAYNSGLADNSGNCTFYATVHYTNDPERTSTIRSIIMVENNNLLTRKINTFLHKDTAYYDLMQDQIVL